MVVVKCCSGCGVVKSLDDFHRRRASADGRESRCKECKSARNRRYREENRAKLLECKRLHYKENRDKERELRRRWREENRDKISERNRRYYEENRDKEREYQHRYREENRECVNRQNSRRMSRYQSVTESAATKRGPWSEAEIAILMADDGRTILAKALELGRTYNSCNRKRQRLHRTGVTN